MFVDILDCYLLKNLAVNGGYLDEVHFITHTDKRPDLRWLDGLVATNKNYKRVDIEGDFSSLWREHATEAETMYIKIDDDIVSGLGRQFRGLWILRDSQRDRSMWTTTPYPASSIRY